MISCIRSSAIDSSESYSTTGTTSKFTNPSIAAETPRKFPWWDNKCDKHIDQLEGTTGGAKRFVAFHDEESNDENGNKSISVKTNNWLHVTSSEPLRRVQYEMRYVEALKTMSGVVRFGVDCEGPPGYVHGGAMATVADATTATAVFESSQKWGLTTRLVCNYREMIPVNTPVRVEAKVTELKKRRASVEWKISSLSEHDGKGDAVRFSFGTADFLLPRE